VEPAAPASSSASAAPDTKPDIPSLKLQTFAGQAYDLAEHRGRWVVVNFWATWCTPCLKEIPDLNAFDKARDDVEVIGLAYEEIERADMEAFLKEHPIEYPIAVVDTFNPPADFDTPPGLPMTYLIAPDGKVAKQFLGPVTSEELAKLIGAAGKAAATP
jgi:thiol-disulfide isomerase/thioredoxin